MKYHIYFFVLTCSGTRQPVDLIPVAEGKFECTYYPVDEGKCTVDVKYNNQAVPNRFVLAS